ncbi:MAG TPA: hypothetical protein VGI46_15825 [Candidatus Acidoferrum sp.]
MSELQSTTSARLPNALTDRPTAFPWWLQTIVLLGAFLMAAGALIAVLNPAMLVSPHDEINAAVRIYAGYLFSRNAALAVLLVAALLFRAKSMLNTLILLTAFIQLLDAAVDCIEGRWVIVPGVAVFGLLYLLAAGRLSRHPFWRKQAWSTSP